jgi:gamma-glutamylcyclotransferase (GGCT)/AIG2-like uncharacterized protein YtfP
MRYYFSFGSNMSRAHMERLCRGAEALGIARLDHHHFFIAHAGYASIARKRGAVVYGVLWKVTAAHIAKLDTYESVADGLYGEALIPVHHGERLLRALAYVASDPRPGLPKPGYQESVVAAAREWQLPEAYVRELETYLHA